ncbi:nucleotide exchange factor GrpE [Allobacillus sp. SKP8-2]|uniref:Protein GrpE n=1 Tax=Allobacillus saliphilus TaxID=2912308 RepID=A0A941CVT4_9BACI|nr:nucleotide exchange factor GrpE [Allobacillus saliphilus]
MVTDPEDHFDEVIKEENEKNEDTNQVENETEESRDANSEENQSELNQLKDENADLNDRLLRLQADFDNYKRRMKKEKEMDLKYKSQELATEIIPVLDNFERALQTGADQENVASFVEGVEMVYQQLQQALEKVGVTEIEAEGKEFDPTIHQAVMQVEEDGYDSNQVIEVLQKGYQLKDRVIRPAMVKVNQ